MLLSSNSTREGLGETISPLWVRTLLPLHSSSSLTWMSTTHTIIGGRHPTVDIGLQEQGRQFTANDCTVGGNESILLITG